MRNFTNEEIDELAQFVFYKVIWEYITFYDEKRFTQKRTFPVYEDMIFTMTWKKIGLRHFLFTEITPSVGYTLTSDDKEVLETLSLIFLPKTLDKLIIWYKDCEKRISKGQLPTAQPSFRE
jgi:hypothetical protein